MFVTMLNNPQTTIDMIKDGWELVNIEGSDVYMKYNDNPDTTFIADTTDKFSEDDAEELIELLEDYGYEVINNVGYTIEIQGRWIGRK